MIYEDFDRHFLFPFLRTHCISGGFSSYPCSLSKSQSHEVNLPTFQSFMSFLHIFDELTGKYDIDNLSVFSGLAFAHIEFLVCLLASKYLLPI